MGIKKKQSSPKPNIPSNLERWQVLALDAARHTEAVRLIQTAHPNIGLVEAARRVKDFHSKNLGKYNA